MKHYYGVIYLKNGSACICAACQSEEEVRAEMAKAVTREIASHNPPVATTFITREVEGDAPAPTLQDILGHPRSRDLLQDKAFTKGLFA